MFGPYIIFIYPYTFEGTEGLPYMIQLAHYNRHGHEKSFLELFLYEWKIATNIWEL
jgi:hypothetical protein